MNKVSFFAGPVSKVEEDVYLGSKGYTRELITFLKIETIVNFAQEVCLEKHLIHLGINPEALRLKEYPIKDTDDQDISSIFSDFYDFMGMCKRPVLVTCFAGRSRSSAMLVSYYMRRNGWGVAKAMDFVKEKRFILPNSGFVKQLKNYETLLERKKSDSKLKKNLPGADDSGVDISGNFVFKSIDTNDSQSEQSLPIYI